MSVWASRATPAGVGGFSLLAVLVYVADEHPAAYAGAATLQASVVRLYGVVVILGRWVRVGCARLCGRDNGRRSCHALLHYGRGTGGRTAALVA
jgi:hypothetical protein